MGGKLPRWKYMKRIAATYEFMPRRKCAPFYRWKYDIYWNRLRNYNSTAWMQFEICSWNPDGDLKKKNKILTLWFWTEVFFFSGRFRYLHNNIIKIACDAMRCDEQHFSHFGFESFCICCTMPYSKSSVRLHHAKPYHFTKLQFPFSHRNAYEWNLLHFLYAIICSRKYRTAGIESDQLSF